MDGYRSDNIATSGSNYSHTNFSHVNQPTYSTGLGMQQPPAHPQTMHPMAQNQWPSSMERNSHMSSHQTPQYQQYSQSVWPAQIQHQPSLNQATGMGGFNMPFISQQIIQDAFAMSAPVGVADENTLLQALLASRSRRQTYKDALNGLHGKNGHSASLWKDYYLEHKHRLDENIAIYLNSQTVAPQTAKKPSPGTYKSEFSPVMPSRPPPKPHKPVETVQPTRPTQPSASRRSTINSLTTHTPVFDDRLPPPNAEIKIPEPPSRSPSPPTVIIPHKGRGNKYTPADRDFFLKFISWRLKCDPTLTRNDLCMQLSEKAPHHTAQSWASHWSNRHDVPDKIFAAARADGYDSGERSEPGKNERTSIRRKNERISIGRRPTYRESSSDSDDDSTSATSGNISDDDSNDDSDDDSDDGPPRIYDESDMGYKGGPFTDADTYFIAKYVANFRVFYNATAKERWEPCHEHFPQRSAKSWAEFYRRNKKSIRKLAKKIQKNDEAKEPSLSPNPPSRSNVVSSIECDDVPQSKRKLSLADDEGANTTGRNKRRKGDDNSA